MFINRQEMAFTMELLLLLLNVMRGLVLPSATLHLTQTHFA